MAWLTLTSGWKLSDLTRRRVLVVEDEVLVAMLIEDMLSDLGFEVIGPATRLKRALELAREETFDLAVLDVNLANEHSFPVADALQERNIPFIFATGYGLKGIEERFHGAITLQKPFEAHQLERAISITLAK